MKAIVAIGSSILLIGAAIAVAAPVEFNGSTCESSQCGDPACIVATVDVATTTCTSKKQCAVWGHGQSQPIPFKVCMDSSSSTAKCTAAPLPSGTDPVNCGEGDYWLCSCMSTDNQCNTSACACSGQARGRKTITVESTCT